MSDRLYAILAFTGIPMGGTQTLSHGLSLNGTLLVPDYVTPQYPGTFEVVSATSTQLTLRNVSDATTGNCDVWCMAIHPVTRMLGGPPDDGNIHQHLTPQPFVLGSPSTTPGSFDTFNVKRFGAVGDGVHNDGPAINEAITAANATLSSGAFGAMVTFPKGIYLTEEQIIQKNGVGLWGEGPSASQIIPSSTFNFPSLVRTEHQDGTQEFAYIIGMGFDGRENAGAICSTAVVDFSGVFVTSLMYNVLVTNGSNVGLRVVCQGTPGGMGPIRFDTVWLVANVGDDLFAGEIAGNTGAGAGLMFTNLVCEHQGAGAAAIHLVGQGHVIGWLFDGVHIEMGGPATNRKAIVMDGVPFVMLNNVQIQSGGAAGTSGITITNNAANVGIQIRQVTNINLVNPILQDLLNGVTRGAINIRTYNTPDVTLLGQRFEPVNGKSIVALDTAGTERAWFDSTGALTGESFTGAALDVVADTVNNRALSMSDNNPTPLSRRSFGFMFPDASSFRLRYFTAGVDLIQFNNAGDTFVYNPTTFQSLMTLQASLKGPGTNAAAPSTGTHTRGEIVFNADPVAAGFIGWVCVTGGTPGTWKSWGVISA